MSTQVDLQQLLAEAEAAYHQLVTGTSVVEVRDQSGDTVRYQAAHAGRLKAYIEEIRRKLGLRNASPRPMRVWL